MSRNSGETPRDNSDAGVVPVLGDIILLGVAVLASLLIIILVLDLTGVLSESDPIATFEFTYEGNVSAEYVDSFGTTNKNGSYDGVLTITHAHGTAVPATTLYVNGTSSQSDMVSWAETSNGTDGPNYDTTDVIGSSHDLQVWVEEDDAVTVFWNKEDEDPAKIAGWDHEDR